VVARPDTDTGVRTSRIEVSVRSFRREHYVLNPETIDGVDHSPCEILLGRKLLEVTVG
jgi:hypothetical protein